MRWRARPIHRDLGYFYVGLIIAFSLSGIFLNHRTSWYPTNYRYNAEQIKIELPANPEEINDAFIDDLSQQWGIEDQLKGYNTRRGQLRITYKDYLVELDLQTGEGVKESYFEVPLLAQSTMLHKDTDLSWVWYSDIFGVAMLVIAVTGMFIQKGKTSFRKRGWKLALAGMVFPLIFLFLLA